MANVEKDLLDSVLEEWFGSKKLAKFCLERYVENGQEYVKIKCWENVKSLKELPTAYLYSYPRFMLDGDRVIVEQNSHRMGFIKKGQVMKADKWDNVYLPIMLEAGERLAEIMRKKRRRVVEEEVII